MPIPGHIFALLPGGSWIKNEFLHCNVLYFSMMDIEFIAVTDCDNPVELIAIKDALTNATRFKCNDTIIKAVDHNMSIAQFEDHMAELANNESIV